MARASTTSDVFNAVGDVHRRAILDVLLAGEKAVGAIVGEVPMPQPQVSRHLRVLGDVGLVQCRAEGRRRLYRLAPEALRPIRDWVSQYERAINARLDRIEDYLATLQREGDDGGT
ncbi:MAG TPA: metalloregulator ArsR/SmtB family transcription factor [Nocardioides sp.]|uniref:ArsR/SmtB family transcription factor n=1 Tax=Nocardioides sp. TaxID=35761 RepID=UPI002F4052ED